MATKPRNACSMLERRILTGSPRSAATAATQARALGCGFIEDPTPSLADALARCMETLVTVKGRTFTARVGPGCAPKGKRAPTPKQVEWRERFAEALRAAARGEAPGGCPPADPACQTTDRNRTTVITPQGRDRAHYAVFAADDLAASHDPMTFSPDPRYPSNVQEREYQFDPNEQAKVQRNAQALDPAVLLHRSPTAVDGPPLVTEDGCVLGGNGRSMMTKRAYKQFPDRADAYREALACAAADFGLSSREVRSTRDPILVRVIDGTTCDDDPAELARAVRRYNEGLTQAIDVRALGVSEARQIKPGTVATFGQLISGDRTLRDVMRDEPAAIVRALEQDGVITAQNRTTWVSGDGSLTDQGKDRIEAMFLGRVLGSADRIRSAPAAVLGKLEKAVPYLTAVAGRNPGFDLTKPTQEAVDLIAKANAAGASLESTIQQRGIFEAPPSREATEIARMLVGLKPTEIRNRFAAWSQKADFDPNQPSMFGRPASFEDAFQALTTAPRVGRSLFVGTVINQERTPGRPAQLARVVGMYDPGARGGDALRPGEARIEYVTGPRRGEREVADVSVLGDVVG